MEQIETQASDLRYLAQAPVALSDTASVSYDDTPRPGPHGSPSGSAGYGDNSAAPGSASNTTNKRKSVDDAAAQKQTRSKRNRVSWIFVRVLVLAPCGAYFVCYFD